MNKIKYGFLFGCAAGIIDVIPMILQKLPLNADLSAFFTWVAIGVLISVSSIGLNPVLKGLVISFIVVIPTLFIIAWSDKTVLIPVITMTIILGSALGYFIEKTVPKDNI